MPKVDENAVDRARELVQGIRDNLEELNEIFKRSGATMVNERFQAYGYPHILMALTADHNYMGGSMCTVEKSIEELAEFVAEQSEFDATQDEQGVARPRGSRRRSRLRKKKARE